MNKLFFAGNGVKRATLAGLLAALSCLSAHAGLYNVNEVVEANNNLNPGEVTISGLGSSMTSVELILTFNGSDLLTSSALAGSSLTAVSAAGSPYVTFTPVGNTSADVYTVTFTGSPFDGLNPNGQWDLNLVNSSPLEDTLVSWDLEITAVPEPVNVALGMFAGLAAFGCGLRRYWRNHSSAS